MLKESPFAQVWGMVITPLANVLVPGAQEVPVTFVAAVVLPLANAVHPVGTGPRVTYEPVEKAEPTGDVNVKVRVPVELATTLVGATDIVPAPLAAFPRTVTVGCGAMSAKLLLPPPARLAVVNVAAPVPLCAVAPGPVTP